MTSPPGTPPASDGLADGLATTLAPVLGTPVAIDGLRRLTGGASRETWSFRANREALILRRDPPGRPNAPGAMQREADAMRACRRAGLRVPDVLVDDDGTGLGTAGLVMRHVAGETIARRILRDDAYAEARRVLVRDLARFLAGLHALDPAEVPGLEARDPLADSQARYERGEDRSPVFDKTREWLVAHRPAPAAAVVVHGDLRLGNVIVDERGLAAAIDWELVQLGDPLQDLAYLCLKAWRFGGPGEAAGLGTVDELLTEYEVAGGRSVDRDAFHWWLVERTYHWGVGCMAQGDAHLSGRVRSMELAAVGRRAAEQEWDLVELLAPDAARATLDAPLPTPLPDDATLYGRPTARELLDAVAGFLADDVAASDDPRLAYQARVALNVVRMVERELAHPATRRAGDDWNTLALDVRDRLTVANPRHLKSIRSD
jgi:aminoglycoside phosphotransferase (APT) family kinase protein